MEDDDIQTPLPASKYSRVSSNGRMGSSRVGSGPEAQPDSKSEAQRGIPTIATANGGDVVMGANRLRQWPHSSRIIRVSRASGGKDRHSKVWTAKGPRDRRVRLSVSTAIQFYDLQDRLGYDQPSKAVEWLIKAASEAINELPSLNSSNFPPETPRQPSDEPRAGNVLDSGDAELDGDPGLGQNQMGSMSKSGCSSNNSETSKGSGLSLSRSEIRVKARERARERTAKEKEKETDQQHQHQHRQQQPTSRINVNVGQQQQHHQNVNSIAPTSSFTQLLTAGISNLKYESNAGANSSPSSRGANQWLSSAATTPMDYFGGLINPNSSRGNQPTSGYHVGGVSLAQVMTISSFNNENHNGQHHNSSHNQQHELHQQHFPFVTDQHLLQVANTGGASGSGAGGGSDYNLSFSISSTSASSGGHNLGAGFNNNRGPLQSNSPPFLLPYLQSGSSAPFFLGGAAVENHQQQHFQPTGLQLYYGDTAGQSDQKGKGKN